MAMDAAQLAQLLAAVNINRSTKRLTVFSTGDDVEWKTWRANFTIVAQINNWNDERQRQEAAAAMEGAAKRAVSDVDYELMDNVTALLDAFEARFVTTAASDLARVTFLNSKQSAGETVLQWHTRIRDLFVRAYPGQAINIARTLIDQFILGLSEAKVVEFVWDRRPATFAEALEQANNKMASLAVLANRRNPRTDAGTVQVKTEPGLHMVGSYSPQDGQCWFCKQAGHQRNSCPMLTEAKRILQPNNGNSGNGGGPQRGRGRGGRGYGGRGRRNGGWNNGRRGRGGWNNGSGRGRGGNQGQADREGNRPGVHALVGDGTEKEGDYQQESNEEYFESYSPNMQSGNQ